MGLATGEAELRAGDYFGAVLNRAARVMAAGHGGQILLADSTAGLLSGIDLLDLGPRRLRDLPAAVGIFQVRTSGLRTDFPPLRTLDTAPGNLRRAPGSFIGREAELDAVATELKSHRLVTLTGVGGVGKTRLATEVATRLADEFPDGVWLFELAPVGDPDAVPDAVAAILGRHPTTRQERERVGGHGARRPSPAAGHRQLRTCTRRDGRSDRRNPRALGDREDPGHQPRRAWRRRRAAVAGAVAGRQRGHRLGCGGAVPRTCAHRRPRHLASHTGRVSGNRGDLPTPRRDPLGDRAGSLANGVDERTRSARPAG